MSGVVLRDIAAFLNAYFDAGRYADDTNGVYAPSERPVKRFGVALEPWPGLAAWIEDARLDGLFLHRPWKLAEYPPLRFPLPDTDAPPIPNDALNESPSQLASELVSNPASESPLVVSDVQSIGVLSYHLPFDEYLTLGYNPRLADALQLRGIEVLGEKEGRPLGMIGDCAPQSFAVVRDMLGAIFGGYDEALMPRSEADIGRVAVMGAMTDALVREAAERGAQLYVTGQFRAPARLAVQETGVGVAVIGHRRSELWGLVALAGLLRERWASLEILLAP